MTQYVTSPPTASFLNYPTVTMAIEFPDESCPPMRCIRHSNRTDRLFMLTAVHLLTNLSAVGFKKRKTFLFFPRYTYKRSRWECTFSSRPRVVLTLYLKLGLNSTLDAGVRVWHFPGKGIFTHLSQASALGQGLKIIWGRCSEAVHNKTSESFSVLLLPNWPQDPLTFFIGCFDSVRVQILPTGL